MLVLALATFATHGWSLGDGLFLDDHWHQRQLQMRGWSLSDLLHTTTLEPDQFMKTWWQEKPIRWQYARPVSIALMKLAYLASGGNVPAQHAVSILLHFANACLVYVLCMWLTAHRFWSLVGGLLFVIYSHSVFAVGWLASQNIVLQTGLMLGAMLVYVRASGLRLHPAKALGAPLSSPEDATQAGRSPSAQRPSVPHLNRGLFAWAVILFVLAVFSRENAVMLPVILVAFDFAFGGRRHVRARLGVYAFLGFLTIAFFIWRTVYFYHPIPGVYMRRPDGEGSYALWCLAKFMHYLCSAVWLSPMTVGPTGRYNPFTEVPGDCLLMVVILGIMGSGYYLACRNARGYWIWPLWLALSFLPVVPIMATPHSGYLGGVGFSVAMVLGPGLRDCIRPISIGRWCRPIAIWFLIATSTYIPIYRTLWSGMLAAERYTIAKISTAPAPTEVTDIFFINVPFVNIYSKLCLEEAWGRSMEDVQCHVMTYAPNLVRMEDRCIVEQIDAYRFSVSVEGRPFFSSLLGRYLIESMRESGPLQSGEKVSSGLFDAEVVDADMTGVRKLLFTFRRPLASERFRFYLTTRNCVAARVYFRTKDEKSVGVPPLAKLSLSPEDVVLAGRRLASGDGAAAEILFSGMHSGLPALMSRSWSAFRQVALPVAEAMGSPIQGKLEETLPTPVVLSKIRSWWLNAVKDETLEALWLRHNDFQEIREARDGIFTVRGIASMIIRTDLYLTGPPFPGPR